ncbi:MAG: T9SS type A sorting domain-containing protein [Bacteroidales bacterium]
MRNIRIITLIIILVSSLKVTAQKSLFFEGFETGTKPMGWSEIYVSGTEPWRYRNGGHSPNDNNWLVPADEEDITRNPPSAHTGTYNAIFFKQSTNNEKTMLVTKAIDLSESIKPELNFWLCQVPWTFSGSTNWDILRVYYKNSFSGDWTLLQEYLDPLEEWTQYKINLPNPTSTYYIAFEGQTRWGYGTCIDDVTIEETGLQDRYVSELTVSQADYSFIPSGSSNEPILRLGLKVFGNAGSATLKTLVVKSLNTNDTDISSEGVKLYQTATTIFNTENPIGPGNNFNNGYVTFNNLNLDLPNGQSYLWLTYDISPTATHGDIMDAMLEAGSIQVGDSLYPQINESPIGNRIIYETIYKQTFDEVHEWTLSGEFEVGIPQGKGGAYLGYPDPTAAYSGTKVLGTDLSGLGEIEGDYESNILEANADKAVSPSINALFYKDLKVSYRRYLNVEVWDKATVDVSNNNGTTWNNIWYNNNYFTDNLWTKTSHDVTSSLSRSNQLKFRFKLGPTDGASSYSGWNVDDFVVTGDYITKDVGVVEWVYPKSGCGNTSVDSVIVKIANLGAAESPSSFPVQYSFDNGSTWVTNFVNQSIPAGDTIEFTFTTKVNLSAPGIRYVKARTKLTGDEDASNDAISSTIYLVPTYTLPFTEQFEDNNGHWRTFGTSLWQWGISSKPSINSSTKAWITSLTKNYGDVLVGKSDTLFFDDFTAAINWTLTGEFEIDTPMFYSDTIPYYVYSGLSSLGTDLTRLGSNPGMYENGIEWNATSTDINIGSYTNLQLHFFRWFKIAEGDTAKIQVSNNGTAWTTIWSNNGLADMSDEYWMEATLDIPNSIANGNNLKIRFSIITNNDGIVAEGINVEDIMLTGNQYSSDYAYLQSPCFDFTGISMPVIDLSVYNNSEANADGTTLFYSTDKGETWNIINNSETHDDYWNWYSDSLVTSIGDAGWNGIDDQWRGSKHLLPSSLANQSNVIFRFGFKSDKANNDFGGTAIDNVNLYEAPFDIGVESVLSPTTTCDLSNQQNIQLRIKNYGVRDLQVDDTVIVAINVEHPMIIDNQTDTVILTTPITAGNSIDYDISKKFNMSISGQYNITATTLIESDPQFYNAACNDTAITSVTVQKPYIELGSDIYTLQPDTVILVATNPDPLVTYKWYKAPDMVTVIETNDSLHVPTIDGGKFFVTLENDIPCSATDSISVNRLIRDVGISSYDSPITSCELTAETPFRAYVKNYGTDTLTVGDTIQLNYIFNGGSMVDSSWVMDKILLPNDSLLFTFNEQFDMKAVGTYTLKSWATVWLDEDADNDTTDITINVWGYPSYSLMDTMGLTNDTIKIFNINYTVDAGIWDAYLWQNDSSTNETYVASISEWAKVTVFDNHNCPATDSIFVDLRFSDISVDTVVNPNTACEINGIVYPFIKIKNTGTDTIASGTNITLKYYLNNILKESTILTLDSKLPPNDTKDIIFSVGVDLSEKTNYEFDFYASTGSDSKPENDSIHHTVSVFGYPNLELGDSVFTRNSNYTLDAGSGRDNYSWSTTETTQQITVSETNLYKVTVIENGMCYAADSVYVTFLYHDYTLNQISNPISSCSTTVPQEFVVKYTNIGNDTLKTGQQIKFGYQIDDDLFAEENYTLTSDLEPYQHILYTFLGNIDISEANTKHIVAYGIYSDDYITNNDTLNVDIEIKESPTVDLGEDRTVRSGNVTLDGGEGNDYVYAWQDNSSNRFLIAENTGDYWVTTTAPNGCFDQDTVHIILLTPDYRVSSIISPTSACGLSDAEIIQVEIENVGTDTMQIGQTLYISYEVNSVLQQTQAVTMSQKFKPGDKINQTFTKTYNMSNTGTYSINAYTTYSLDLNPYNNSSTSTVIAWGNPTVNLGTDTAICQGMSITLDAGTTGTSYLWSNSATSQTIDVNSANEYWVEITDSHGCTSRDTIMVSINSLPTVTHTSINPVCANTESFTLTGGNPSDGIYSGIGVSSNIFNAATAGVGTHTLTYLYTDVNGCSNTTTVDITVNALPVVDLGENRTVTEPLTLDAGSGYVSYLWQDNSTNQTLTVQSSGLYSVTVTDGNGCEGYDEVYITFNETIDVYVSNLVSPVSQCFDNTDQPVTVEFTNRGTKTFTSGEQIEISYKIGTNDPVKEQYTFSSDFAQNSSLQHTFTGNVLSDIGNYTISCYTTIAGENGDTTDFDVSIYNHPNFSFDSDTIKTKLPYVLQSGVGNVTYLWNTGATTPSITVSQHGKYWLRVTDSHACQASDTVVIWWPVSAEVISGIDAKVQLFPNPVKEELNIWIESTTDDVYNIELINPQGVIVHKQQTIKAEKITDKIIMNNFSSGLYFIRISNDKGSAVFKLIKN